MRLAIIGAGPGGLAAARWLKSRGFDPEIFEAAGDLGGCLRKESERPRDPLTRDERDR